MLSVLRMVLQMTIKAFRLFYYRFLETKSLLVLTQVLQGLAHSLKGNKPEFEAAFLLRRFVLEMLPFCYHTEVF